MRLDHLLSKEYPEIHISSLSCSVFRGLLSIKEIGALAQLGERLLCTQEVSGSIPLGSIDSFCYQIRSLKMDIEVKRIKTNREHRVE